MLSDPVAEAFGLIHRHPSGENFWHGMASVRSKFLGGGKGWWMGRGVAVKDA